MYQLKLSALCDLIELLCTLHIITILGLGNVDCIGCVQVGTGIFVYCQYYVPEVSTV